MKIFKVYLAVTLLAVLGLAFSAPQEARADREAANSPGEIEGLRDKVHKIEVSIGEDRDKIIAETKAIREDRRRIKDAGRLSDKTKAVQIKEDAGQDIKKREALIKDLKSSIRVKKEERSEFMYGKGQKIARRRVGG